MKHLDETESGICRMQRIYPKSMTGRGSAMPYDKSTEDLRQRLLDEIYAGAAFWVGAMLRNEQKI